MVSARNMFNSTLIELGGPNKTERFEEAFSPAQSVDFNGFSVAVTEGYNVESVPYDARVSEGARAISDTGGFNNACLFSFDTRIVAFGIDINNWEKSWFNLTATIIRAPGAFTNHVIALGEYPAQPYDQFWGVMDPADGFRGIVIDEGVGPGRTGLDFAVHQPIPEPATVAPLGFGLAGLGRCRSKT